MTVIIGMDSSFRITHMRMCKIPLVVYIQNNNLQPFYDGGERVEQVAGAAGESVKPRHHKTIWIWK